MLLRRLPMRILVPSLAAIILLPLVIFCARSYGEHALYFDQMIYQYTAWSIRHGDKLYDSVAVLDGPLITLLHAGIQTIAGESDAAFRWGDLVIQLFGAMTIAVALAPYRLRLPWAAMFVAVFFAQYFRFDWGAVAQREAYYGLIGYAGMAVLLLATRRQGRRAIVLSLVGGFLVGMTLWGKQLGLVFIALGLVPALFVRPRRRYLGWALAGVGSSLVVLVALIAAIGQLRGYVFWHLEVPQVFRHAMVSQDFWPLLAAIDRHTTVLAGLALVIGSVAVWRRWLPRRYAGFAVAPVAFLLMMLIQKKGWIYQAHPITAGAYLFFTVLVMHLVRRPSRNAQLAGAALALLLVVDAAHELATSSWIDPHPVTLASQLGEPHVNHADMMAAAKKLTEITGPEDRVLAYGPAGRVLFEAKRRSAVPPFNNFFLNLTSAVSAELTPDQREHLAKIQRGIARRSCKRVDKPPAAALLCDWAAWSSGSPWADLKEVCPKLDYLQEPLYTLVGKYGCWSVLKRNTP
jgi:hypothetical protein